MRQVAYNTIRSSSVRPQDGAIIQFSRSSSIWPQDGGIIQFFRSSLLWPPDGALIQSSRSSSLWPPDGGIIQSSRRSPQVSKQLFTKSFSKMFSIKVTFCNIFMIKIKLILVTFTEGGNTVLIQPISPS